MSRSVSQDEKSEFQRRFKMKAEDGSDGIEMAKKCPFGLVCVCVSVDTLCKVVKGTSEVGRCLTELRHLDQFRLGLAYCLHQGGTIRLQGG